MTALLEFHVRMQSVRDERGQDLVEYAFLLALIALGSTAALNSLASQIGSVFAAVGAKLATYST